MFVRFTNPEGRGAWVRASRVLAFTEQDDGATRLFMGYGLQTDVQESPAEVERLLTGEEKDPAG